jgi:hypothetical protein
MAEVEPRKRVTGDPFCQSDGQEAWFPGSCQNYPLWRIRRNLGSWDLLEWRACDEHILGVLAQVVYQTGNFIVKKKP